MFAVSFLMLSQDLLSNAWDLCVGEILCPFWQSAGVQTLLDTNAVLQDLVTQMRISAVNGEHAKQVPNRWSPIGYKIMYVDPYWWTYLAAFHITSHAVTSLCQRIRLLVWKFGNAIRYICQIRIDHCQAQLHLTTLGVGLLWVMYKPHNSIAHYKASITLISINECRRVITWIKPCFPGFECICV